MCGGPTHASLQMWHAPDYGMATPTVNVNAAQAGMMHPPITTTMLRNIPQRFDRELLLEHLISNGFGGAFDFVYMPNDFSTGVNLGYAFINFVSEDVYMQFKLMYAGVKLAEESPKVCEVCDAKVQGKSQNVDFYRNSTVMNMDPLYHPVLFENGVRQPFPLPTRQLGPVAWKSGITKNTMRMNSGHGGGFHGVRGWNRRRDA